MHLVVFESTTTTSTLLSGEDVPFELKLIGNKKLMYKMALEPNMHHRSRVLDI